VTGQRLPHGGVTALGYDINTHLYGVAWKLAPVPRRRTPTKP
jgi:hypothetical protein